MVDGRFPELQALILQMAAENRPWGEKMNPSRARKIGILVRVSAWGVAKYTRPRRNRGPSPRWREFLEWWRGGSHLRSVAAPPSGALLSRSRVVETS